MPMHMLPCRDRLLVLLAVFVIPLSLALVEWRPSPLPQFQKRGYATELLGGLLKWALAQPGVHRVAAETEWDNPASVRVLEKAGFALVGPTGEPGGQRFEYPRGRE